jgi:hypothetical protein
MIEIQTPPHFRNHAIPVGVEPLFIFDSDAHIKEHPAYFNAKGGDSLSAMHLIGDLALKTIYSHRERFGQNCIFVAPHAQEALGDNAIPQVMAMVCALVCGAKADKDIVQSTRVYHTGADPMERLVLRPEFLGRVEPRAKYVLVDDVITLGGTLAELASYVQSNGGVVQDVFVLANAGRKKTLHPESKTIRLIRSRFENEIFEIFGIPIHALTANEANYLVGFRSTDEIRNRVIKAKQEIHLRLRSKGVRLDTSAHP